MERPRFVHFAKLGSARAIYPKSSPATPTSPCGGFGIAMAPLASSEPDIAGAGGKTSAPSVPQTASPSPSSANRVTLLREPIRRGGSTTPYGDLDRVQSPLVTGVSTIPRLSDQRTHRHNRSGSLEEETAPHRYQRQTPKGNGNSSLYYKGALGPGSQQKAKAKELIAHKTTPSHASSQHANSRSFGFAKNVRSPGPSAFSVQSNLADNYKQQKPSNATESVIPRVTNSRPALHNQGTSSIDSLTQHESQSSPLQIRRVLRSSPAFAQFQQKNSPSKNDLGISKLGKPNTSKSGSNPNFCNGLSMQEPTSKLQKYSCQSRTSSESSLASKDTPHISSAKSLSNIQSTATSNKDRLRYHRSENKPVASHISYQQSLQKNRPMNLSLKNSVETTSGCNTTPSALPTRRIPRPSGQVAQTPPASTPNGSHLLRCKPELSQTPTKSKPKYYQRHPDAVKSGVYHADKSSKGVRTSNFGTPQKSPPDKSKDGRYDNAKGSHDVSSPVHIESLPQENSHCKYASKAPAHKQGFGFGYTCTANASIKKKQITSKTAVKLEGNTHASCAQTINTARVGQTIGKNTAKTTFSNIKRDFTDETQFQECDDSSLDSNAFQGSWKRNSMRLATQGYSSMSDLTKSVDCLILEPDSQLSSRNSADAEGDSLLSSDSYSSQSNTLSRQDKAKKPDIKESSFKINDGIRKKENCGMLNFVSEKSPANPLHSRVPDRTSSTKNVNSSPLAIDSVNKSPAVRPKEQSCGIPIKQAYFADSSFILVPGVPSDSCDEDISRRMSYPSPSGSPSSGYSSSPASRERHPSTEYDNYYDQQNHQNKIKRRSFVLATTSISDLSYYLDDVDAPKAATLPSFVAINEVFHTPESQRRQPHSLTIQGSGHLSSSFGSYYSCQSQASPTPKLSPPISSEDKRGSFYDNCQDSPKETAHRPHVKDGYESEDSTPDSEYKTASSSSFVIRRGLNPTDRDDRIRAKLLSRHWVRNTPYRHSRFSTDQTISNYNRYRAQPLPAARHQFITRPDQCYAQSFPKENNREKILEETRKGKDKQKQSKKSPSPPESRKMLKIRMTSPIAWCTSSRTAENKRGKSPAADQRKRSNSSPFPNGRLSPSRSHDIPQSVTSPAVSQTGDGVSNNNQIYRCQAEAQYSPDYHNSELVSIDSDSGEFFDAESDDRWAEPPRFPPSLGRPRRKEYAGFDSQPLPMDSYVSDSSSVYTDNTSMCSSRAASRSADVESYSRRSSVASSTREFAACSRAFSSGASGALTPRRQLSDDTICEDLSYQGRLSASQHLEDHAFSDKEDKTLSNISIGEVNHPRSQSFSVSTSKATDPGLSEKFKKNFESQELSGQLRGCISSQSYAQLNGVSVAANLPIKAQSCLVGRRPSDSSSGKSSTSGFSSDNYSEDSQTETQPAERQQQQKSFKETMTRSCPSKRKYFSSRDILDLLITPEKSPGAGLTSMSSLERQAQKVCRAILCCNSMNRSMPPGEFQF